MYNVLLIHISLTYSFYNFLFQKYEQQEQNSTLCIHRTVIVQKLIYLNLSTEHFMKIFCSKINLYETVLTNADKLASVILCALNTLITCDSKTNLKSEIINPHIMLCDRCGIRDYNSYFNFSPG